MLNLKTTILSSLILLTLAPKSVLAKEEQEFILARITYYCPDPKWGRQTVSGINAKQGITIAAHSDFKLGTKVYIPALNGVLGDGEFIIRDRGPALQRKVASKGKGYVFDVFVKNKEILNRLAKKNKMWMKVYVKER